MRNSGNQSEYMKLHTKIAGATETSALWNKACICSLVFLLTAYLILAALLPAAPYGESSSNMVAAISLSNHMSFRITSADVEQFYKLFPSHASGFASYYEYLPHTESGIYPWYVGVYAPLCIPLLKILILFHLDPLYAFPLTNALFFALALWVVYRFLDIGPKRKLMCIIFLGTSPIIRYINKQIYEVVLFSFVVIAMTFWLTERNKPAAFFLSIAGTMNITIMAFGMMMIADYFWGIFLRSGKRIRPFWNNCLSQWKDIALYAACFAPCLISVAISYRLFGGPASAASSIQNSTDFSGSVGRFWAYLTDLNFGLLPYITFMLGLFVIICWIGSARGKHRLFFTFLGAAGTIFAYSLMSQINCGMTGIARYNSWLLPIIVMTVIFCFNKVFVSKVGKIIAAVLIICSAVLSITVTGVTAFFGHEGCFSPVAKWVLNTVPQLYNPLPSTFNARINHSDVGYEIKEPVIYISEGGYVRKAMVTKDMMETCKENFSVPETDVEVFVKECGKVQDAGKFYYLNFSPQTHIYYVNKWYEMGDTVCFDNTESDAHLYFWGGISGTETDFAWTDNNLGELQFGLPIKDYLEKDLVLSLDVGIYHAPQNMIVTCREVPIFSGLVEQVSTINIRIPAEAVVDNYIGLTFRFPNAASPYERGEGFDTRRIALAIKSFTVNYAND